MGGVTGGVLREEGGCISGSGKIGAEGSPCTPVPSCNFSSCCRMEQTQLLDWDGEDDPCNGAGDSGEAPNPVGRLHLLSNKYGPEKGKHRFLCLCTPPKGVLSASSQMVC